MRVFFSGAGHLMHDYLLPMGVKNILVSYEDPDGVDTGAMDLAGGKDPLLSAMMMDSGAFSAWNAGRAINLNEYIEFAKEFVAKYAGKLGHTYVVNLDVIPGERGLRPSKSMIEDAAREGWENMVKMEKAGLSPVHVFHYGEDWDILEKLSKRHRYIGLSPTKVHGTPEKGRWLQKAFAVIKDQKNMCHGFAVTSYKLMTDFPWYSVDSTSWMAPLMYGQSSFTPRDFIKAKTINTRVKSHITYFVRSEIKALLAMQKKVTALWKARGVIWEDES